MDGWGFKQYVLGMLFYRFISENLREYLRSDDPGRDMTVASYVEEEDVREVVDIAVLNAEIRRIVARESGLCAQIDAIVADLEGGAA